MAGRGRDRSRPARRKRPKRRQDEEDDTSDTTVEESKHDFCQKRPTKRQRLELSSGHFPDIQNCSPCPYSFVINGSPAAKGQFPYQVALQFSRTNGDIAKGGGIIIGFQWILTAAHLCKDAKRAVVLAGAYPTQNDAEQTAEADLIVIQDAYLRDNINSRFIVHDIALLRLKEPLKGTDQVQTISLPSKSELKCDFAGQLGILSGWGKTGDIDGKLSEGISTLNYARETILSNKEAAKMLQVAELPSTILAAIGTDGRACSCNGDSGGPLVLKGQKGKLIVVGVVSHRIGRCGGPLPHMLTRVTSYVDWITRITQSSLKERL